MNYIQKICLISLILTSIAHASVCEDVYTMPLFQSKWLKINNTPESAKALRQLMSKMEMPEKIELIDKIANNFIYKVQTAFSEMPDLAKKFKFANTDEKKLALLARIRKDIPEELIPFGMMS